MSIDQKFAHWCILEVMGHQKFAGFVTEETIAGQAFIRIDVPGWETIHGTQAPFSRMFGPGSIYCITPTSEQIARQVAERLSRRPVDVYDFPEAFRAKMLTALEGSHLDAVPVPETDEELADEIENDLSDDDWHR